MIPKILTMLLGLTLILAVACGSAPAATPTPVAELTPAQEADPTPTTAAGETPQPTPVAEPTPVPELPEAATPTGTLNAGLAELGTFTGHPTMATPPAQAIVNTTIGESLMFPDINNEIKGWLIESWSISEDYTTWTLNLRQDVQFHKGYGEMTAEDMVWSYAEGWAQNDRHSRVAEFNRFWTYPEGSVETPDRYTVMVNTGQPLSEANALQDWMMQPSITAHWVASKRQTEEVGVEAADRDIAATGPWELVETRTAELWRMRAVENHWLQTPYFEELIVWEIPEESARIAGFQTGQLDTFQMAFDSISLVESVPEAKLMKVPGGTHYTLRFYGGYYAEAVAGDPPASYDPEVPWISGNPDPDSDEWQQAVKVRQAMIMAIDRQAIIDTILHGLARPSVLVGWSNNEDRLEGRRWEYNPDRARELLAEAGYADGFGITLTPSIRGAAGEIEVCEAVATMWNNELGLDVNFQNIPYQTLRPGLVPSGGLTYQGATCHPTSPRLVVGSLSQLTTAAGFRMGATHPVIEDLSPRIAAAVVDAERERLEEEMGAFLFDNALTAIGLFVGDVVWPVGPRIEEWTEHVKTRDLQRMNGYEYIRPRQ